MTAIIWVGVPLVAGAALVFAADPFVSGPEDAAVEAVVARAAVLNGVAARTGVEVVVSRGAADDVVAAAAEDVVVTVAATLMAARRRERMIFNTVFLLVHALRGPRILRCPGPLPSVVRSPADVPARHDRPGRWYGGTLKEPSDGPHEGIREAAPQLSLR
jgi:hypothetical protein